MGGGRGRPRGSARRGAAGCGVSLVCTHLVFQGEWWLRWRLFISKIGKGREQGRGVLFESMKRGIDRWVGDKGKGCARLDHHGIYRTSRT